MTEKLPHKQLKTEARKILKEKYNFGDSEIYEEYLYMFKNSVKVKIDVVGKNSNRFVAVECGNTPKLKQEDLKQELGKENVVILPYKDVILDPSFYMEPKERKEKIKLMKAVYNKYIYEKLKDDPDFGLKEYFEEGDYYFYIGKKRWVWMAFPTKKSTINGRKLQFEINLTLSYIDDNTYEITINAETNDAIKQFLELSEKTKELIVKELRKLPSSFFTQDGIKYKTEKVRMPPYLRNWEVSDPIQCNQMSNEKLQEIENRLEWYLKEGKKFEEYPILSLVRIEVKKEELAKALMILKPIYELSFKFRTKRQDQETHDYLRMLEEKRKLYENDLIDPDQEDYENVVKEIFRIQEENKGKL